jgi:hypothetical protein
MCFAFDGNIQITTTNVMTNCKILLTHVHLGFELRTLVPEGGRGRPKHVAWNFGFN